MNKYNESYIALVKIASELVSQGNNDMSNRVMEVAKVYFELIVESEREKQKLEIKKRHNNKENNYGNNL